MGHDPRADWPAPPFHRDRNHLFAAAGSGFGTVNLDRIDWQSEVSTPHILLQMGQVRWSGVDGALQASWRALSGDHPEQGLWMKFVEPHGAEGEHFEVYERTLARIKAMGL